MLASPQFCSWGIKMTALLHDISARKKDFWADVSKIDDFTLEPGSTVAHETVLRAPEWSLYCLDLEQDKALFVELPKGTDLAEAAFVYNAQFDTALRAVTMPLDTMIAMARHIPDTTKLALLFSTGRCGSTLASRILARLPNVWSLSEPDYFTNLALARFTLDPARTAALIAAATRLTCRPPAGRQIDTVVIKPRSEAIMQADCYVQAMPKARNVFLYRDLEGYTASIYKFVQRIMGEEAFFSSIESWRADWPIISVNASLSLIDDYFGSDRGEISWAEVVVIAWDIRIEAYLAAVQHGSPFTALHYTDLNSDRRTGTARLLAGCGIPASNLDLALQGFERDSQAGSGVEKSVPAREMTDTDRANIHAVLRRLGKTDFLNTRLPDSTPGRRGGAL